MPYKKYNCPHDPITYLSSRPPYPQELFIWLSSLPQFNDTALDCGTGPGIVLEKLGPYFNRKIGLDVNLKQLKQANRKEDVLYINSDSETLPLKNESIDLITVACSIHWFSIDKFFKEVKRVIAPGGVVAVWTYGWPVIGDQRINEILNQFKQDIIGEIWPDEIKIYLEGLTQLHFPFIEISSPKFSIDCLEWGPTEILKFLTSMSGPQMYINKFGINPTELIRKDLESAWYHAIQTPRVNFPIFLKVGKP